MGGDLPWWHAKIRRLADQTAEATLDIEHIVKGDSLRRRGRRGGHGAIRPTEVHQGAQEVRTVKAQLAQIIAQVQTLSPRFDTVHAGMQAQAQGAQQISAAMVQLRDTAQQTMASWQASARAIAQLSKVSQSTRGHNGALRSV